MSSVPKGFIGMFDTVKKRLENGDVKLALLLEWYLNDAPSYDVVSDFPVSPDIVTNDMKDSKDSKTIEKLTSSEASALWENISKLEYQLAEQSIENAVLRKHVADVTIKTNILRIEKSTLQKTIADLRQQLESLLSNDSISST